MASHAVLVSNTTDFQAFTTRVEQDAANVRSLSITLNPESLVDLHTETDDPLAASESTQQLWQLLLAFSTTLPSLTNLHSFTLRVLKGENSFLIPRPLIATLLSNLPPACTSLEIDTSGSDRAEPGTLHLCEAIRSVLPRLECLRVDLSTLCAGMFEIDTPCPNLKTLTISCFAAGYFNSRICASYPSNPSNSSFPQGSEAMPLLIHHLQTAIHQQQLMPNLKRCIVVDQSGNPSTNSAFHLTYNCRDVRRDVVTAMLVEYVHPFADDGDGYMLRKPDEDVFGSLRALRAACALGGGVGGNNIGSAVDSSGGAPSSQEQAEANPEAAPTLLSAEAWKVKYPRRGSRLWSSDQRNGGKQVEGAKVVAGAATRARVAKLLGPEDEGVIVLRDYEGEEW